MEGEDREGQGGRPRATLSLGSLPWQHRDRGRSWREAVGLSGSTFRLLPDGLWGATGGIASRSAPASAGTPPARPNPEAPGKRVPLPGLWLQKQQEQQGRHPPRLEARGSQSSPRGAPPALPPALPRALPLPLPPMPWLPGRRSQAAACPRSGAEVGVSPWLAQTLGGLLGAAGGLGARTHSTAAASAVSLTGLRAPAHAHARTRARAPAHLLGPRIQAAPAPHPHPHPDPPAGGTAPGRHRLHPRTSLCPPDALTDCPPA